MRLSEFNEQTEQVVRQYDYDDASVVVADLGMNDDSLSIDVVDGTAILVLDAGTGDPVQRELELPDGDPVATLINNGVVSVEVSR